MLVEARKWLACVHLQGQAVVGERGEFSGVAAEPLDLVQGIDDTAARGAGHALARRTSTSSGWALRGCGCWSPR